MRKILLGLTLMLQGCVTIPEIPLLISEASLFDLCRWNSEMEADDPLLPEVRAKLLTTITEDPVRWDVTIDYPAIVAQEFRIGMSISAAHCVNLALSEKWRNQSAGGTLVRYELRLTHNKFMHVTSYKGRVTDVSYIYI